MEETGVGIDEPKFAFETERRQSCAVHALEIKNIKDEQRATKTIALEIRKMLTGNGELGIIDKLRIVHDDYLSRQEKKTDVKKRVLGLRFDVYRAVILAILGAVGMMVTTIFAKMVFWT